MSRALDKQDPLVIAVASYLNAAPLIEGLADDPGVRLRHDVPSALKHYLEEGSADAALVPVVDHLFGAATDMIDGLGVAADGRVCSVFLRCHKPPQTVQTVAIDTASHTSNLLARLILKLRFDAQVELVPAGEAKAADAEVMIGDRALVQCPADELDLDLALQWKRLTGLPFVFAVWAYKPGNGQAAELSRLLHAAAARGAGVLRQIADRFAPRLGLPAETCLTYLEECLCWKVGDREKQAIAKFKELLITHRLRPEDTATPFQL